MKLGASLNRLTLAPAGKLRFMPKLKKIPSEMGVAPPHKRFTQFSALIKL